MIQGKTVLAVIPARGGSKGVPRKNIRQLAGKPLIAWTIEAAQQSAYLDRIVVSTEDEEIAEVARQYGAEIPFLRPRELAQDDTPGIDPVLHAVECLPFYDFVVLLQPTSPLREASDIDRCIEMCVSRGERACVSVTAADKPPQWMYQLDRDFRLQPIVPQAQLLTRRQDAPHVFVLNGAVYVAQTEWLKRSRSFLTENTAAYVMPKERSLDIDSELDLRIAAELLKATT
ncbi:cytidylyltransferase domain-containing protein [Brevibacillus marinus]|uniref:acylneuraminate cytidylyltransferase family protein n=1 Tax=Brevibacillus marinus TaxID=2496837 RepID=UPI000F843511|nr:acylneuraminate cytidylyltransferase family protein [Brevibacillus marinus]